MKRILVIGAIAVAFCLLVLLSPFLLRNTPSADRAEAMNNLRLVHAALLDFDADFGRFPDSSTIADVQKATATTTLALGTTTSNDFFRQLIANGRPIITEKTFWARTPISPRKPNGIHGSDALVKGECAFAYIAGLTSSDDPSTPVAMVPVEPAKRIFEQLKSFKNQALVLFLDGSVKALPIGKHGEVQLNGMDLFDPRQPFWKGKAPDIKWPE